MKISEETFYETFKPQVNHLDGNASHNGCMYETFGKEIDYAHSMVDSKRVWTIIEGDNDSLYISAGFHIVNRQGFLITEKPYDTGLEEVCLQEEMTAKRIRKEWNKFLADHNMKIGSIKENDDEEEYVIVVKDKTTNKTIESFESSFGLQDAVNEMEWFFANDEATDEKGNKFTYRCIFRHDLENKKLIRFNKKEGIRKFKSADLSKIKKFISEQK
ncbi:MAG: hypothetical protein AABY15_06695 [Nanoarchaeota archaeon]